MPGSIDAIILDFGGVFTESHFAVFEHAAAEIGARPELLIEVVFGPYDRDTDHPWHRLERGESSLADAHAEIMALAAERALEIDPLRILARMARGGLRGAVVERTRALRRAGYRTALLTNNVHEFREGWRSLLPEDPLFDAVIDSSEVGLRKPDPAIYRLALERLGGVPPQRTVFLDDFAGNVDAAERLGMRGVVVGADVGAALAELDRQLSA